MFRKLIAAMFLLSAILACTPAYVHCEDYKRVCGVEVDSGH